MVNWPVIAGGALGDLRAALLGSNLCGDGMLIGIDPLTQAWRAWQATEREGSSVERDHAWLHFVALVARAIKAQYIRDRPTLAKHPNT